MQELFDWLLNLPLVFIQFFGWLTTDLPYINMSPLAIFSFGGITILIGILLVRLFIGG